MSHTFYGAGILGQLSWLVLAWLFLMRFQLHASKGCSNLKACLGLEGTLPRWFIHMVD